MFPFGFFAAALFLGAGATGAYNAMKREDERSKYNRMLREQQLLAEQKLEQEVQLRRNNASRFLAEGSTIYDEIEAYRTSTLQYLELQTRMNKKKSSFGSDFTSSIAKGLGLYSQFQGSLKSEFPTKGPLNDRKRSNN